MQYRRKHQRYLIQTPLKYQDLRSLKSGSSSCCDISSGGISFLAHESLAKGASIQVTIPVNDQVFKRTGHVAYSNHMANVNRYRTGLEFEDEVAGFNTKLEEQQFKIKYYQDQLSQELKREISEEEAARRWVDKYMRQFSTLF